MLDGFPRTIPQAEELAERARAPRAATSPPCCSIDAPDEEVIRRLSGRRVCKDNGHVYHLDFDPPEERGLLRPGRLAADPARRRQGGDGQAPPRGLPRADQAAGRLLREAGAAAPLRRHPRARRGERPHPGHACHTSSRRGTLHGDHPQDARGDRGDRRRGPRGGALPPAAARQGARRGHHRRARRGRREVHPLPGRRARVPRLPRLSRARSAPRPTRWWCTASPAPTRSSRGDVLSVDIGVELDGWVADAAVTLPIGPVSAGGQGAARTPPAARSTRGSSRRGPATASATSRPPSSAGWRPTATRSSARWWATGWGATCTRTRRSRTSASPAPARSSRRAWSWRSSRW